ncbi:nitrogenase component 1, partial [Rhizobium johnstonii]|uniref:nitrogenase component 1 n=1 Tax=Rhizobium johnstonii TaxID=3019933 RepID=UPI003F98FD7F
MSSIETQMRDASAKIFRTTEAKETCHNASQGSAASGGCAFDGAKIVLQPITDVAHLVHAPLACEGNSWDNRGAASSGPVLWRTSFTTDLTELDIVTGDSERKLLKAIREIKEGYAPAAIFVYGTCVTELIGDDIDAVCRQAAQKFAIPVVPMTCSSRASPARRLPRFFEPPKP